MNDKEPKDRARAEKPRQEPNSMRRDGAPQAAALLLELAQGALVGLLACLLFAGALGASAPAVLVAGIGGACAGSVIGLLLWVGSTALSDDPVVPPDCEREARRRRR